MSEYFHEGATLVIEVDLGEGTRKFSKYKCIIFFDMVKDRGIFPGTPPNCGCNSVIIDQISARY